MRHAVFWAALSISAVSFAQTPTTLTIAAVSNPDMVRLQQLSGEFTRQHPDIRLNWVTLDENTLRQQVTTDIATRGGRFDIVSIGTYEIPIWAKRGWLSRLDTMPADYDANDLLPGVRESQSVDGVDYAAPFYGESAFTYYRKDLFKEAGIEMPTAPSWDFIREAATRLTEENPDIDAVCLRGKPGWGENMATITAMANAHGARWFDEQWRPQFDSEPWARTLRTYVGLLKDFGSDDAAHLGFKENLERFQQGKCAIWVDATVAASVVTDPGQSSVADQVGFAQAPDAGMGKRSNWLWVWSLAIASDSSHQEAAKEFVAWATSKEYAALVAQTDGWNHAPPGTRASLYANTEYLKAAPYAPLVLQALESSHPDKPTVHPVPYQGIQYVSIPEFPGIATAVGSQFARVVAGSLSPEDALDRAQWVSTKVMERARFMSTP